MEDVAGLFVVLALLYGTAIAKPLGHMGLSASWPSFHLLGNGRKIYEKKQNGTESGTGKMGQQVGVHPGAFQVLREGLDKQIYERVADKYFKNAS